MILFPYQGLFEFPYQATTFLINQIGSRRNRKVDEALKSIRISYDGSSYQKVPHSPKDPEGWSTSLHPDQVSAINSILVRMNCPSAGMTDWKASGLDPVLASRNSPERTKSSRESSSRRSSSSDSFGPPSSGSSDNQFRSDRSRSGKTGSRRSSKSGRSRRRDDNDDSDD